MIFLALDLAKQQTAITKFIFAHFAYESRHSAMDQPLPPPLSASPPDKLPSGRSITFAKYADLATIREDERIAAG
jgi:hypothetical protein